jgi:carboxylate-amine ligase
VSSADLRRLFDGAPAGEPTIGVEEELMLLDAETLDLAPVATDVLARLERDPRFKAELPAAQLELLTTPAEDLRDLAAQLRRTRRDLARAAEGIGVLAGSGAHPFAEAEGELNPAETYRLTREEYGPVARRQLVFGLHVHLRIGGADRSLAVYNALRSYLGEIAALAANAPLHDGRDTGLASIRPKISETLPRQGVPPAFDDLDEFAAALDWAAAAGVAPEPRMWWWELRLHPVHGTIEIRVPDQQTTVGETVAVAGFVRSLVLDLAARYDDGEALPVHPSWRIAENRWSAARHGLDGTIADLETGERRPTRERLSELIDRVGADAARDLANENGAIRQRKWAAAGGPAGATRELTERFGA